MGGASVALVKSCAVAEGATLAEVTAGGIVDPVFGEVVTRARLSWVVYGAGDARGWDYGGNSPRPQPIPQSPLVACAVDHPRQPRAGDHRGKYRIDDPRYRHILQCRALANRA